MPTSPVPTALAAVRACRDQARSADLALVCSLVDWAVEHQVEADSAGAGDAAVWGDHGLRLAGAGAPAVSEFALFDLAATLGRGIEATRTQVGQVLEVRYRLPKLWRRVKAGEVVCWRAFRVAEKTISLTAQGALFVDDCLAPYAGSLSTAQLDRTIVEAVARYDPEEAWRRVVDSAEHRRVEIDLGLRSPVPGTFAALGVTVEVTATLDLTDALDLEKAVRHTAAQLATLGSTETGDVRRALALGEIARAQLTLDLGTTEGTEAGTGRAVSLNVHLHPDTDIGALDQPGLTGSVWISQIKDWCQSAGTSVKVLPVIDLNEEKQTGSYTPTKTIRRHVELINPTCVAPYCTRPARACDLDHIDPHADGGPTSTVNLAPLCRGHHRAKTHHPGWTYHQVRPGVHRWTTPSGATYTVDRNGTHPTPSPPG